jgi:small GTP-binding protein
MLLTPPGAAAIAVVRLSGNNVRQFLTAHCSRPPLPGRAVHTELRAGSDTIDDPLVYFSPDERFADVSLHGGSWVVRSAMELMRRSGFEPQHRLVLPLPAEAVDADCELDREVLTHLPKATTELALQTLLAQPQAWQHLKAQSRVEKSQLQRILGDRSLWWLLRPPRVAVVGAANVGKSTLANRLFGQERSITADLPGTTRDWVGELANLDGLTVMLVDTPGLRDTEDPIERLAIDRSGGQVQQADLVVLVLDASRPLEPEQSPLMERFAGALWVMNKSDLPRWSLGRKDAAQTVATTGVGVLQLMARIRAHFGCEQIVPHSPRVWTDRQRSIAERALINPDSQAQILAEL